MRTFSKNDGDRSKGHMSQLEGAPTSQINVFSAVYFLLEILYGFRNKNLRNRSLLSRLRRLWIRAFCISIEFKAEPKRNMQETIFPNYLNLFCRKISPETENFTQKFLCFYQVYFYYPFLISGIENSEKIICYYSHDVMSINLFSWFWSDNTS